MGIEVINCAELAREVKKRKVVMNTRKMHAWVHYYPTPGDHDDMHCHNEDQTFYCIDGQCTMHFPDGGKAVLEPGMAALITGSFVVEKIFQVPGLGFFFVASITDRDYPVLTGVLVTATGQEITMVATDSYRLAVKRTELEAELGAEIDANIPARALRELGRETLVAQKQAAALDRELASKRALVASKRLDLFQSYLSSRGSEDR